MYVIGIVESSTCPDDITFSTIGYWICTMLITKCVALLGPISCSLLSGYERFLSAKKVTVDNVAFHVPCLDYAIDAMHYLAYVTYPHCVNPLSTS